MFKVLYLCPTNLDVDVKCTATLQQTNMQTNKQTFNESFYIRKKELLQGNMTSVSYTEHRRRDALNSEG